ncbi:unnamed protein product [Laminaria digitata]
MFRIHINTWCIKKDCYCLFFCRLRWGVLHFEQEEQTRSQFWGREKQDSVTGRFVREYPMWKRWTRYAMTMPIMVVFTGGVLLTMFMVSVLKDTRGLS